MPTPAETVAEATLTEKLRLLSGRADPTGAATGYVEGIDRLSVDPLRLVDGPMGVTDGAATAFPATTALGATWSPELAREFGRALGRETRARGHDVVLAPAANLVRVPTCGRNFEYPGEDPHHAARLTAATVSGIESTGVGAAVKHFVANNQEQNRDRVDVLVRERALRELYLPAFRAGVDAGASVVMAAYNRVRGRHAAEHQRLLETILRREWGFTGVTVSDWWGTHDGPASLTAGLDLEMPGVSPITRRAPTSYLARAVAAVGLSERLGLDTPLYWRVIDRLVASDGQPDPYPPAMFDDSLRAAVSDGAVSTARIDEAARRVVTLIRQTPETSQRRSPETSQRHNPETSQRHNPGTNHELARRIATRGSVVLQNRGVLPLDDDDHLAVIGPRADGAKVGGGGSSAVTPTRTVDPVTALRSAVSTVTFERGVPRAVVGQSAPLWRRVEQSAPLWRRVGWERHPQMDIAAATRAAAAAETAVVVVQDDAGESADRSSLQLPAPQNRLVAAVAAASSQTVVVCRTSGPVEMPWLDAVDAVVQTWYPGQADGEALAAVLLGRDPGGRLPVTFGAQFDDYPVAGDRRYPGVDDRVRYDEGVFVGYRGFDSTETTPTFPFGHGLSYADFEYTDPTATVDDETVSVGVTVENVTDRPGREVVQVYVDPPETAVPRPPRELCWFQSLELDGGESRRVSGTFPRRALARYDSVDGWTVDDGRYRVRFSHSSRDHRVSTVVHS
jgi:beta-glucosidase